MKGMVIRDMKKMFQRIGAVALAAMLAMSMMATTTMAAVETGQTTLTIENTIKGSTYRIIKVMTMKATRGDAPAETDALGNIIAYDYALADGDDDDVGMAVKAVIDAGDVASGNAPAYPFKVEFEADGTTVKRAGFDYYENADGKTHVRFRLPATFTVGETTYTDPQQVYDKWKEQNEAVFMTKFADAVKAKLEELDKAETINLDALATKVVANAENTGFVLNPDKVTGTLTVSGLDYGYYMIISGAGQRAMLFTTPGGGAEETMTIQEKNDAPTIKKYAYEDADGEYKSENDKGIGDTVRFMSVLDVSSGINNLRFVDTLSKGLTVDMTRIRTWFAPRSHDGKDLLDKDGITKDNLLNWSEDLDLESLKDYSREAYATGLPDETAEADTNYDTGYVWLGMNNVVTSAQAPEKDETGKETGNNVLTLTFDSEWLMSKRRDVNDGPDGEYKLDPIYPDDSRLTPAEKANHAMYNPYLGDMSTPDDDGGLIVIEYYATVNENAVIGEAGNTNTAKLEYGNDPTFVEKNDTSEETTRTYVYELDVLKQALGDASSKLRGAEFTLKRAGKAYNYANHVLNGDTALKLQATDFTAASGDAKAFIQLDQTRYDIAVNAIKAADNHNLKFVKVNEKGETEATKTYEYRLATAAEAAEDGKTTDKLVSDSRGRIIIHGLDSDLYELTETKAPEGYILADKPFYVVLGSVVSTSANATNGTVTMHAYAQDSTEKTKFELASKVDNTAAIEQVKIGNAAGVVMPSTGGIGTTIFYVIGGFLVAGAGALLVVKKRGNREGN